MTQAFRFDLVDLRLFANIAQFDSLSRGAERSHLSLAAASTRIKNLERNVGALLLTRTSRGVALTEAGQAFLHHTRVVLQQMEQLNADMRRFSAGVRGTVRVAANASAMVDLLPAAFRAFLAAQPGVEVELRQHISADAVRAVLDGSVDLALSAGPVEEANLEVLPLRTERFVLITPRGHALARRDRASFSEIFDHELIGLGDANTRHPKFTRFAENVNKTLKYRIHVNNYEDVCRLVSDGIGIAAIPEAVASKYARDIPLEIMRIIDPWALRQINLCVRSPKTLPDFVYELADLITATAKADHRSEAA